MHRSVGRPKKEKALLIGFRQTQVSPSHLRLRKLITFKNKGYNLPFYFSTEKNITKGKRVHVFLISFSMRTRVGIFSLEKDRLRLNSTETAVRYDYTSNFSPTFLGSFGILSFSRCNNFSSLLRLWSIREDIPRTR